MPNFLHAFEPTPILLTLGPIKIHYYGLIMVLAMAAGLAVTLRLAKRQGFDRERIFDLAFWLIINGLAGARVYDVLLEWPYYQSRPLAIFKIWQGGLAIHGALLAGAATIFYYCRRHKLDLRAVAALIVPGVALGQAIGRWGNYFNQELFGRPTSLPWGIPISPANRPLDHLDQTYFHPTFLYESAGNLFIFLILLKMTRSSSAIRHPQSVILAYFLLYSLLRFSLEFIRVDYAPTAWGWRWPQLVSLALAAVSAGLIIHLKISRPKPGLDRSV